MNIVQKINLWRRIGRDYTLSQSFLPYLLAFVMATKVCQVNYFLSMLGLIGVVLVQMSMNMMDDYFDWKSGSVAEYKKLLDEGMKARSHKCFYLINSSVSINQLLFAALFLDFVAGVFGLIIALNVGWHVVAIALFAGVLGVCYSAPYIKLGQRGFGEISIGIIFGPLLMMGAYITAGANVDFTMLYTSIFVGVMVASLAFGHSIMDFDSDKNVGKVTLPVALGSRKKSALVLGLAFVFSYLMVLIGLIKGIYPMPVLLVFLTLPRAFGVLKIMNTDTREKKFWMGVMENWKMHQEEGSDWFMLRFFSIRNTVNDFLILLTLAFLLS